jgi:ribosomal RNA-processing protein 9
MPDAFFATQKPRKRKRTENHVSGSIHSGGRPAKLSRTGGKRNGIAPNKAGPSKPGAQSKRSRVLNEELESNPSNDGDNTGIGAIDDMDLRASDVDSGESEEEDKDETPAEKRLRLARLYLDSIKEGLGV